MKMRREHGMGADGYADMVICRYIDISIQIDRHTDMKCQARYY